MMMPQKLLGDLLERQSQTCPLHVSQDQLADGADACSISEDAPYGHTRASTERDDQVRGWCGLGAGRSSHGYCMKE